MAEPLLELPLQGKYKRLRLIKRGGMGAIYLVRHRQLDELRVIKVMRAELQHDKDLRERFIREARIGQHVRHAIIADQHGLGA